MRQKCAVCSGKAKGEENVGEIYEGDGFGKEKNEDEISAGESTCITHALGWKVTTTSKSWH